MGAPDTPWPRAVDNPPIVRHWLGATLRGDRPPSFPARLPVGVSAVTLVCRTHSILASTPSLSLQTARDDDSASFRVGCLLRENPGASSLVSQLPPGIALPIRDALSRPYSTGAAEATESVESVVTGRGATQPPCVPIDTFATLLPNGTTASAPSGGGGSDGGGGGGRRRGAPVLVDDRGDDGTSIPEAIASARFSTDLRLKEVPMMPDILSEHNYPPPTELRGCLHASLYHCMLHGAAHCLLAREYMSGLIPPHSCITSAIVISFLLLLLLLLLLRSRRRRRRLSHCTTTFSDYHTHHITPHHLHHFRLPQVRRLLGSTRPSRIRVKQTPEMTEHDLAGEQKVSLRLAMQRLLALPTGRGMFTLGTVCRALT